MLFWITNCLWSHGIGQNGGRGSREWNSILIIELNIEYRDLIMSRQEYNWKTQQHDRYYNIDISASSIFFPFFNVYFTGGYHLHPHNKQHTKYKKGKQGWQHKETQIFQKCLQNIPFQQMFPRQNISEMGTFSKCFPGEKGHMEPFHVTERSTSK